jgi:enterochelin esterase-like enzyme
VKPHFVSVPAVADRALAAGGREMILVMPNAFTLYQGSMCSNSATIGDWEDFVAKELVAYIDAHYRTIADRGGRGLAGHSMGGYGAILIGMKHPEVYSSLYLMSPCCMEVGNVRPNPAKVRSSRRRCSRRRRHGRPIPRTRRCSSTCRLRTARCGRRSSPNGRSTRL